MTLGTWDPNLANQKLDAEKTDLSPFIALGTEADVEINSKQLSQEQINQLTPLMKQSREFWQAIAEPLDKDAILNLIRFFTLAEENQSVLEAGNDSPVIALNRLLKKRGTPLDKEMLLWIRKNSSNRYLPNGSVL